MRVVPAISFDGVEVGHALPQLIKRVTVEQIRAYAEASGDRNPIHLDEAFARSVGLPGVIAHGMLTMAFANQMVTDWLADRSAVKRLTGRFTGMVVPGDELTCSGTVVKKDAATRRLTLSVQVSNQRGEKVLTKGVAEAQFPSQRSETNAA
ncbi:MAG TPA: MaoC/PaaZ C-terminal domain-containing protein [Candidatus Dormibacteraeota bacterium]